MMEVDKIYHGNNIDILKTFPDDSIDSVVTDPPYGISFMNKHWDYNVPTVELWKEVYRVLKPGGHMLVACGTRTQHRMAVNIEDAGFEIRDIVAWIYGSGFPKSLNVALAIDKKLGHSDRGHRIAVANRHHPDGTLEPNGENIPPYEAKEEISKQYEGWGTALKPAMELWTLARKPTEGTIAENVMMYGTGGLNIDGCRVGTEIIPEQVSGDTSLMGGIRNDNTNGGYISQEHIGRFPANIIHDGSEEVVELFPSADAGGSLAKPYKTENNVFGEYGEKAPFESYADQGSAARFFYCPKASKEERNMGLYGFEEDTTDDGREKSIDNAFQRGKTMRRNIHPTVKPIDLMRYLCRLITPKGGIVLDPFIGSGTTAIAAKQEKMDYIGIDISQDYVDIAEARIKAAVVQYDIFDFMGDANV